MKKNSIYLSMVVIGIVIIGIIVNLKAIDEDKNKDKDLKPKIVLLAHVYQNPYWYYVRKGAEDAAKERGAILEYNGPQAASVKEGIKFIDMATCANVAGIITYVQHEDEYVPYINKAIDKGIPVVTVDSDAKKSKRIAYVGTDNIEAGKKAAREMSLKLNYKGKVAIIMGGKEAKNQVERIKGFEAYLKRYSDIDIIAKRSSGSYALEAELEAKKILINNDIDGLFCSSALDGIGAAKALKDLDMVNKVKIICFDDLPETIENIKKGYVYEAIVQKPYEMGFRSVNIIMDNIEKLKEGKDCLTNVQVINKQNVYKYTRNEGNNND